MRRNYKSWWHQWNFLAPYYWIKDWLIENKKKILKFFSRLSAIVLAIALSNTLPTAVKELYADWESDRELKKKLEIQMEIDAKKKEDAYTLSLYRKQQEERLNEEKKKQAEIKRLKDIELEIKESFGIGDMIIITWWEPGTGHVAPRGNSKTGHIKKIVNDKIYGDWGDFVLTWGSSHFEKCSYKQMAKIRKEEEKILIKKSLKKKKWKDNMTKDEIEFFAKKGIYLNLVN